MEQLFSASSLATFMRCGKQWEYAYVYAIKSPPNLRMAIGIAAHEAVETNYRQKLGSRLDLDPDDVAAAFSDSFDRVAADIEDEPNETVGQGKDSGIKLIEKYQDEVAPAIQPLYIEQEIQFKVADIPYTGYIDLVDEQERVRDLKTVRKKPTSYPAVAMIGYAVGYRELTGKKESGVTLDYMVRTKEPYYYPAESDGPITDQSISAFAQILKGVSESVQHGIFLPTGLNTGACSWCGYTRICPYFQAT